MRIEHGSWYLTTIKNLGLVVDNVIMGVAVVAWIMAMAYGLYSGQLITALLVATPLLGFCFLLYRFFSTTAIVRMLQVITLMVMISLQVHLLGGMIEAHFGYFVVLAIAIAYFSSQAIIAGALAAAILHLVMHYLQSAGLPVYLFPPEHHSLGIVLLHAMYVAMEAIVLVGIIWLFQPLVRIAQVIVQVTSSDKLEISVSQEACTNPLQQQFYRVLAEHQEVLKRCDSAYEENNRRVGTLEQVSADVKKHAEGSLQSIKTITQSMSDMTESFKQVADQSENSVQLAQQVSDAKDEALSRGQRVILSVRQMEKAVSTASGSVIKLEKDCGRVADVLNEVEEITDQTNMLALNAAIEAARAGEHGRGFAVVADEVRSLATRTMEATTQINEVISDLIRSSKQTVQDINQTRDDLAITAEDSESVNESLESMAEHIERILQSITDISSAAHQQSETANRINQQLSGIEETSVTTVEHAEKTNSLLVDISQSFSQLKAI